MSWRWWDEDVTGPWTENKLLSRKWGLAVGFVVVAVGLDAAGHALEEWTINAIRDVVISFVGVQGFLDMVRYRIIRKRQKEVSRETE